MRKNVVLLAGTSVTTAGALSASLSVVRASRPNASIEERIDDIERNINAIFEDLQSIKSAGHKEADDMRNLISELEKQLESDVREIRTLTEQAFLGDAHWESMGIIWLIVGLVMGISVILLS